MLTPWKAFKGNRNTIIDNDYSGFNAVVANMLLKGSDNVVIGECGKVIDSGNNNLMLK